MTSAHEDEQQPPQTANDSLVYVRTVKLRFNGDQGHVYEAFLDVMRDFKSGRCVFLFCSCFKEIIAPRGPPREKRHLLNRGDKPLKSSYFYCVLLLFKEAAFLLYLFRLALALSLG